MNTNKKPDQPNLDVSSNDAEVPAAAASGRAEASGNLPALLLSELTRGRPLSNTAPQSIQVPLLNYPDYLVSGGIDWFEWSASVDWDQSCFNLLFNSLTEIKNKCQQEGIAQERVFLLGCVPAWIHRMGKTRGGGRGRHFQFCITISGITLALGDWQATKEGADNLYVRLTGRDCLLQGAWESHEFIGSIVEKLGGFIWDEKLSRVDFCLDIANLPIVVLQNLVEQRQFITRLKEVRPQLNLVGDVHTGFTAGKSPQRLIAYDKLAQCQSKTDQEYLQGLLQNRYGGQVPQHASRVEVQLSREYLLRAGIQRPVDALKHGPSALRHYLTETFRLTDRVIVPGTKNHSRAKIHPLWESLIQGFEHVFGMPAERPVAIDRSKVNPIQLLKQSLGCLRNALLQKGKNISSFDDFIAQAADELKNLYSTSEEQEDFIEEYQFRLTEHKR